jgi:hypothetical protein
MRNLEMQHLQFLHSGESLLLRLIDDFLLITTNAAHAKQFLQIMHDGLPTYGVRVNPNKTLANFETTINGKKVPRLVGTHKFPYCGSFIDTKNLNLTKNRERKETQSGFIFMHGKHSADLRSHNGFFNCRIFENAGKIFSPEGPE